MAITSYQQNGKTLWKIYLNFRSSSNPKIRVQKRIFDIKTEAAAVSEEKKLIKLMTEELMRKEGYGLPWETIIERWEIAMKSAVAQMRYSPQTIMDHMALLRKWTESWLKRPASEINRGDVRKVLNELILGGTTCSFQARVKNTINVVYTWGIEESLIKKVDRSPTYGVQVTKIIDEKPPEILNIDQIRSFLATAKRLEHPWFPIWAMALLTGMRNGELYALLWSDVDLKGRRITVSKSFNKRLRITKSTKAGYWRSVPISDELHTLLAELKLSSGSREYVLPRDGNWQKGLQAMVTRGFCNGIGLPSIKFHTLRACFATQLLKHNIAPARVMKICGWKDFKTMMRYIRLAGIEEAGATDCLNVLSSDTEVMGQVAQLFDTQKP